ncbi:hypothetical protein D3C76_1418400 [compost metagenome]
MPLPQIIPNPEVAGSYTITFQPVGVDDQLSETSEQQEVAVPHDIHATPEEILIPQEKESTVDVLADKTGTLLQKASQESIRLVVSLFGSVTE